MSTLDVVAEILREVAPRAIKSREIARLAGDRLPTQSRTPETVVSRDLAIDVKRHGATSRFLRADRGAFLLKEALPHAFYNDVEPYVAQWTRNLIAAGEIAAGVVDERSIRNLRPADVASYRQCHFFSGVGVWSRALRDAGWPDDANVWSGSCPCFPAGTLVLTQRGNIPIEDVQVGDVVLTHRARWRRVQATGSEISDCVQLKGQGHWGMVCTPGHPFLSGDEEWTAADQMQGKRWSTVAQVPSFMEIPPLETNRGTFYDTYSKGFRAKGEKAGKLVYLGLYRTKAEAQAARDAAVRDGRVDVRGADAVDTASIAFARFLGYWVGDGWTSRGSVFICGAKEDRDFLEALMESARLSSSLSIERTSSRARCGSKALVAWLNLHFGQGAAHKRIPAWLHGASAEYRQAFLSGYLMADGSRELNSRSKSPILTFGTVSRALAVGTRILLNQAGISASICLFTKRGKGIIEGRVVNQQPFFKVTAYDKARSFSFCEFHGRGLVRTVTPAGKSCVYNLAVEEDESYCADGIVVHNCTPFSAAGRKRGFSDEQHLWPEWFRLIKACRPSWIFGEQVSSKDGLAWIDAVRIDLEGADYTLRVLDLPAASVGAPHRRQRLYFVAYARERRLEILRTSWLHDRRQSGDDAARRCSTDVASSVSDAERIVRDTGRECGPYGWEAVESDRYGEVDGARTCGTLGMGDAGFAGSGWDSRAVPGAQAAREGERIPTGSFTNESLSASADDGSVAVNGSFEDEFPEDGGEARELVRGAADAAGAFWKPGERIRFRDDPSWGGAVGGFWVAGVEWIYCRPEPGHEDGRWRPAQSEVEPLAYGPSVDMGRTRAKRLRGFGNAIVLPLATEFVASVLDVLADAIDLEEVKSTPESTVAEITSDPEAVNVDPVAIPIVRESADLDAAEHVA